MEVNDILDDYQPPLGIEADMLFVATSAPAAPLHQSFPGTPFLAIADRVPLVLWFSRVRSLLYGPATERRTLGEMDGFGYDELNVVALLRRRAIFVPAIYATSGLTQRLGHRYGMPKREVEMEFRTGEGWIRSSAAFATGRSEVAARLLASGSLLARPFDMATPWWSWPAHFPGGSSVRSRVMRVPRAQLASVDGVLRLDEPWLPGERELWRLGIFVPGFRMELPWPNEPAATP